MRQPQYHNPTTVHPMIIVHPSLLSDECTAHHPIPLLCPTQEEFSKSRCKKQTMENSTMKESEEAPLSKKEESNHEKDDEQDTTVEEANMWPAMAV